MNTLGNLAALSLQSNPTLVLSAQDALEKTRQLLTYDKLRPLITLESLDAAEEPLIPLEKTLEAALTAATEANLPCTDVFFLKATLHSVRTARWWAGCVKGDYPQYPESVLPVGEWQCAYAPYQRVEGL